MLLPAQDDYIRVLTTMIDTCHRDQPPGASFGRPCTYTQRGLLLFFLLMQLRRITSFQAQQRWLASHPQEAQQLGLERLPHRSTLSRRYRALAPLLEQLIAHVGQWATPLLPPTEATEATEATEPLARPAIEDKSLFKACGPVWHQGDRQAGVIPAGLRGLDTEASWGYSEYHGWVYGYGLHLTVNQHGFPLLGQVETAAVHESHVLADKKAALVQLAPTDVVADDAYTCIERTRQWTQQEIVLLTAGKRLGRKGDKGAYRNFIAQPANQGLLRARKTTIEPIFDLVSKVSGTSGEQKQLPVPGLGRVQPFLLLGVLGVQLAMIVNCIWQLPLRNISHMLAVLT